MGLVVVADRVGELRPAGNGSRLVAEGGNARLTDQVRRALGRPPRTFATWAQDNRGAFAV
ncbi:hypothetical protein [Streptomyces sp. NPDC006510]|uniref:hypothetical protein n=1 Tax=Streptomyces sp. NPDC006510 TaxID=3155600 RepID=UPI0033BDE3DC